MKSCHKILALLFLTTSLIFNTAHAKLSIKEKDYLKKYISLVNDSRDFNSYVESLKPFLSKDDYDTLKDIAKYHAGKPSPRINVTGTGTLEISVGSEIARIEVVSLENEIYVVNNKKIDLSETKNLQEKIVLLAKAFPQKTAGATRGILFHLLVPEAHAFLPLAAWGAWATWTMIAGSTAAAAGGTYYANQNQCKELGETLDSCNAQVGVLESFAAKSDILAQQIFGYSPDGKKVRKSDGTRKTNEEDTEEMMNLKLWIQYRQKKAQGTCPDFPVNQELDKETSEIIKNARRISEQTTAKLARCQSTLKSNFQKTWEGKVSTVHELLGKCYKNISLVALDLCLPGSSRIIKDHIAEDLDSGITPLVQIPEPGKPTPTTAVSAPKTNSSDKGNGSR